MTGFWATSSLPSLNEHSASSTELLLLADAAPEIGAGHAMRCAALAEAWREQQLGRATFLGRVTIPFVSARLRRAGVEIISQRPSGNGLRVIVVDSYDPVRRGQGLETAGTLRVLVDDLAESVPSGFDVIWNPNAYGASTMYPRFRGAVVAGPDAVPLRGGLPTWPGPANVERAIGVSLGGGDIPDILRTAIEELPARFPGWTIYGVGSWAGSAVREIPVENPWPQLVRCDRILISSGTTTWEAAAVGIPVALVQTAANQALIFDWARRAGAPGVILADAGHEQTLAGRLGEAVAAAARLPQIRSGAVNVARTLVQLASERVASP